MNKTLWLPEIRFFPVDQRDPGKINSVVISIRGETSSSAIAEKPRCRVGQFWPKVEDDILQT